MTLAQLKAVCEVVTCGSVSLAARKLYLSQPAVTKQIRVLEEGLGVTLFERSGKRLLPTPALHALLPQIEKLVRGMEGLREAIPAGASRRREEEINGTICIGSGLVLSQTIMPKVIAACRRRFPNLQVILLEAAIREQIIRMRRGEFRIAFGSDYISQANVGFTPLLEDELVLIAPENHPLAEGRGRLALTEVVRHDSWITHYFAGGAEAILRRAGVPRRLLLSNNPVGARTTNTGTMIAMVSAGLGICVVPRYLVRLVGGQHLVMRELDPPLPVSYGYYQLADVALNPAELAFLEVMRETFKHWHDATKAEETGIAGS